MIDLESLRFDPDGLIPAVVQDADSGRVLMVAWMNEASLTASLSTGKATFWSRSRNELWVKGQTSGNELEVVEIAPDCDADTLLILARPAGPACHTGATTCFDPVGQPAVAELGRLWATIRSRAESPPEGSYTHELLSGGDLVARKLLEEAGELAFAAKDHSAGGDRTRVVEEAADLTYHLLALLTQHGIGLDELSQELGKRS